MIDNEAVRDKWTMLLAIVISNYYFPELFSHILIISFFLSFKRGDDIYDLCSVIMKCVLQGRVFIRF